MTPLPPPSGDMEKLLKEHEQLAIESSELLIGYVTWGVEKKKEWTKRLIRVSNGMAKSIRALEVDLRERKEREKKVRELLGQISEKRYWRERGAGLTWEGETPDGNEIEPRTPIDLANEALSLLSK